MATNDFTTLPLFKCCSKCKMELPATPDYFKPDKRRRFGLGSWCIKCHQQSENKRKKGQAFKDRRNQKRRKRYASDPVYAEKERRKVREYADNHPEYGQTRRERASSRYHEVLKYDPLVRIRWKTTAAARRARLQSLPDSFTDQDWQRALDYFNGCCAVCGRPQGLWHILAADHWIPISSPNCPGTVASNIVPLCHGKGGCNNSKKDNDPYFWLTRHYSKRKVQEIVNRVHGYFQWLDI